MKNKPLKRVLFIALAVFLFAAVIFVALSPLWLKKDRTTASAQASYPINSGNRYLENWGGQNVITFPAQEFTYSPLMSVSAGNFMNVKMQWGINPNVTPTNTNGLFLRIETLTNNNSSVQMFAFSDEGFYTSDSLTGDDKAILTQAYYGPQALPGHTTQLTVNYLENNIQTINRNFRVDYTLNCTRTATSKSRYWEFTSTIIDISNEQNNPIATYTMLNNIAAPSAGDMTEVIVKKYADGSNMTYTYLSTLPTGNNTYSTLYFYINTSIDSNAIYSQEQYDKYGESQYEAGYSAGSSESYNQGYNAGYSVGLTQGQATTWENLNVVGLFLAPVNSFLSTPIFGSFSIGTALSVVLVVLLGAIFIKMFAGG